MLRLTIALLLLCSSAYADDAPTLLGTASHGITVYLDQAGNADFRAGQVIWLDDGRELHRDGDHWRVIPSSDVPVIDLKPIDMALYGDRYLGKRVRVQGTEVFGVSVEWGILRLPGAGITVLFKGADRESLRPLIEHCQGFGENPACAVDITATVGQLTDGKLALVDPTLAPLQAPIRTHYSADGKLADLLRGKI